MGMENYIFWFEIRSGFEELGGTPPPRIPRSTPREIYLKKLLQTEFKAVIIIITLKIKH